MSFYDYFYDGCMEGDKEGQWHSEQPEFNLR